MSLKYKISILHLIIGMVTISFLYMIYDSYIETQKKDIENKLMKVLKLNELHMKKSLANIEELISSKKSLSKKLHMKVKKNLENKPNLSLDDLREKNQIDFDLKAQNLDIEIFLIDSSYKVVNSTHKKNLGLNLKNIEKAKLTLDSLTKVGEFAFSENVSVDFLDYEMKSYSYSKFSDKTYLGLGIIYKDSINEKKGFDSMREITNTNMDLLCVMKDNEGNEYYESLIAHKKKFESNEEYLKSKKKFPIYQDTDDFVINTSRTWDVQNNKKENTLSIYLPLMKEKNPMIGIPGDIVLQVDLDISEQNNFINSVLLKLIIFISIHIILVFTIFYFTKRYQKVEDRLKSQIAKNRELMQYNNQFISNLVHQIRTPFTIIMTNISMLEDRLTKETKENALQINASINFLSNSYENLSYYFSYKSLFYHKKKLDVSSFIYKRVMFFNHIASANKKSIVLSINESFIYEINDIELERLIDNTLSNALYFCKVKGTIVVSLQKKENKNILLFKVIDSNLNSIDILDTKMTNYLNETSTLGLANYLVKEIVDKNSIEYHYFKENKSITFKYILN